MTIKVTIIILSLMGWMGKAGESPVCSVDDRRYMAGYAFDEECVNND